MYRCSALLFSITSLLCTSTSHPVNADDVSFFEKRIRPVLVEHCYQCHSAESKSVKGGLLLDTRAGIRQGGDSGHAVVPRDVDESLLISSLRYESFEMPPSGQLDESIIADFEKWIRRGASDPRDGPASDPDIALDIEAGREFWSFQPVTNPQPPESSDPAWSVNHIDDFVRAELDRVQLQPNPDANRETLIRRLSFDLLGLPPSPQEIDAFVSDNSDKAYENLVDRMLQSSHFGERWGRHWLDVVRYAESMGKTRNYPFPFAWRYRDYVINSLNADKPYDQFITEQLAGDLLPAESDEQRDEQLIATGFLALGSHDLNQNNRAVFTMDVVGEQIDTTSRSLMGMTVACARCHDHKFDPIPTQDYYALAGIFRSTAMLNGYGNKRRNKQTYNADGLFHELNTNETIKNSRPQTSRNPKRRAPKLSAANARQLAKAKSTVKELRQQIKQISSNRNLKAKQIRTQTAPLRRQIQQTQKRVRNLTKRVEAAKAPKPKKEKENKPTLAGTLAMGVKEAKRAQDCQVNIRGDVKRLGPTVPRGFLQVVSLEANIPADVSGRLELAEWLTHPEHPLTARVMANRVWHHLFGRGLVRTVDNFGATGSAPSHPELLDYLASQLMREGWSIKQLVRSIVLSRTYRLSSDFDPHNYEVDPANQWLWRMNRRRLEAESIRDAMLAASGSLELTPPTGSIIQDFAISELGRRKNSPTTFLDDVHRTIYLPIVRTKVPAFLTTFDFPEPSEVNGRRDVTTVPTQALFMMNNPFVLKHARLMAKEALTDQSTANDQDRLQLAYQKLLGRRATSAQIKRSLNYIHRTLENENSTREAQLQIWTDVMQALIASSEFRYRS
ncbi:MAG: DUF1553 domain-containing protein [Planctomycetaceae bacterium]|nr:DUF1553 domain-containing protein [Planctomycetaceae bacterium]